MAAEEIIVLGAGPAGLACAAALRMRGLRPAVLDKASALGSSWRGHYDRLHLHTPRGRSALPGLPMPSSYPTYASRAQVVEYLDAYARHHGIEPELNVEVTRVEPRDGGGWRVETGAASRDAAHVIVALGLAGAPNLPSWPGIEGFAGPVVHSSAYHDPAPFAGQRVLVVGLGNSGGEIALDLAEGGARPVISARSPVNVVPRDLLGIPILSLTLLQKVFPYRLVDAINRPVLRLAMGNLAELGFQPPPKGPLAQVVEDGRIPLLDIGTVGAIREGRIGLRPGIARFDGATVHFTDGNHDDFDAVVLATGYRTDLRGLMPGVTEVLDANGKPRVSGGPSGRAGLWFCSYHVSPSGQLAEAGQDALRIAEAICAGKDAGSARRA